MAAPKEGLKRKNIDLNPKDWETFEKVAKDRGIPVKLYVQFLLKEEAQKIRYKSS